jgi:quercetin dioxygenase-like cupin family protein
MRVLICAAALAFAGCVHVEVTEDTMAAGGAIDCSVAPNGTGTVQATPVASHAITDIPGKTLTSVLLTVTPGNKSNAHMHAGVLYGYVIEGAVCSQITGDAALKPYKAGESFFEPSGSQHLAFTNPTGRAAKILVTQVANTGATLTTPVR